MGELFQSIDLIETADKFTSQKFIEVTSADNAEFPDLEKNSLIRLFSRSDLSINSEIDVFKAVKIWIKHDISTRGHYIYELLQTVRLVQLNSDDLEVIAEFCSSSVDCMQRINEAKLYQEKPSHPGAIDVGETIRRGGKIYIFGGGSSGSGSSIIEKFHGETFERKAYLKFERIGHGIAMLNGNIHIAGGCVLGLIGVNSCKMYSPSVDKATMTSPMNFKRWFHGCCTNKRKIYVCGGKNVEASTCCERLESKEGEWRFVASMNVGRECFVVVLCGNHIWAFCGRNVEGEVLNSSEFYDEKKEKWTMTTSMIEIRY